MAAKTLLRLFFESFPGVPSTVSSFVRELENYVVESDSGHGIITVSGGLSPGSKVFQADLQYWKFLQGVSWEVEGARERFFEILGLGERCLLGVVLRTFTTRFRLITGVEYPVSQVRVWRFIPFSQTFEQLVGEELLSFFEQELPPGDHWECDGGRFSPEEWGNFDRILDQTTELLED